MVFRMGIFLCRCGSSEDTSDYDNISNYEGETKLGQRHGKGTYYYGNGEIYDGQWQWGKKHGYGSYSFANGEKKTGFFFNDEYIGNTPGNLFTEEVNEKDPAKPLMQKNYQTLSDVFVPQERSEERERRRREREERQEARRQKREEIKRKYNL